MNEVDRGRLAIIVTELGNNLARHARRGRIVLQAFETPRPVIDVFALDSGPGMDVGRSLVDGFSTYGTGGNGLGAVKRLADAFDAFSDAAHGTSIFARVGSEPRSSLEWGGISIPVAGETVCGDTWAISFDEDRFSLMVADGLGHGMLAAQASRSATELFSKGVGRSPKDILELSHGALSGTRGAAVAVSSVDAEQRALRYSGVGNIAGVAISDGVRKGLCSQNGTVGVRVQRTQQFEYPFAERALLIMTSDGLQTRWDLAAYPGLAQCHPAVIAGALFRDFQRGRDDVTVVVTRSVNRLERPDGSQ
jgi:anti-sigma regulatory factor (Ser/Thr protein kinase)